MPLIRGDVLSHLMGKLRGDGLVLEHEDGFIEPLHAFYAREKSTEVLEKLLPEKRRVRELAGNLDVLKYPTQKLRLFDQELYFLRNINTKEDLSWLEKSVGVL